MFEKELADKFQQIFALKKVTYDAPGESREQECLFIEVEVSDNRIQDGRALAKVTGTCVMFGSNSKLPFGFFAKAIQQANPSLTKDLFFYDIEANTARYRDLVQRGFSFVYFFDSQYDPDNGTLESVTFTYEEQQS